MEQAPWYLIDDVAQLDTPALVLYPDRVKHNIALLKSMIGDVSRLRPHVKTNKSREASRLLLEAGIRKFKCATIAEAEMLAMIGAPDVLLAYQPNEAKMHRLLALMKAYPDTHFSCLVDTITTATTLSELAVAAGLVVPVYIDLNVGMNRTGIAPGGAVLTLYSELDQLPGVRPVGLHAYDGHLRNSDLAIRTSECDAAFWPVQLLSETLTARGFAKPVIVIGGSPTFPIHAKRPDVECSPGTFIYWDKGYQTILPEQGFLPAALVVSRVISLPESSKICVDLGHKSIAPEGDLLSRVTFLNAPELKAVGQSEEHLVLEAGEGHSYKVGDVFYGIPNHVCPTVALYERGYTIENGLTTGEWLAVSRDRVITI
ncbi:D-TA family PLP-dependent enzyme [Spirosoma sp. KCTC 42546]|uniref:D-TA family PLP-dependent enzyme n=1 Tax=Spirosoma sp. KCTC 42546 TaxID=2520506 RepID=UPI001157BBDF|nr:D-TA family PLP-dependent enzyme [Spirosoma sp. KCTC 42546]QDK81001.1 D-TA family PLP-dependent enzyme [Spirosoma sp. KCTC 42546]